MDQPTPPGKFLAIVAVITGIILLPCGLAAASGYLGLPYLLLGEDLLTPQLGQVAAMYLGLAGGGLALTHGLASLNQRPSRPLWLPPVYFFWLVFALVLGLGNLLLNRRISLEYIFPFLFVLGAALPTISVLAYAYQRLGCPITWRQGALAFVAGCTLSVLVAVVLETIIPFGVYLLVGPLAYLAPGAQELFAPSSAGFVERLFLSPLLIFFLVVTALQAPIPEEFAKALGPALFGRRIHNQRQAFAIGLAGGAGFAILENMLYEGMYAEWSGWSWGGITLLRAIGSVLHPLCTALIALVLFRQRDRRPGWFKRLALAFLVSVGLHTLWNGGFDVFVFLTGLDHFSGAGFSFSIYGLYAQALLVIFLVLLSAALWGMLRRFTGQMGAGVAFTPLPAGFSPSTLAAWALACLLVVVPIGAALGQAWSQIRTVFKLP